MKLHEARKLRDELEDCYINGGYRESNRFTNEFGSAHFDMDIKSSDDFALRIIFLGSGNKNFTVNFYSFSAQNDVEDKVKFVKRVFSGKTLFRKAEKECEQMMY